MRIWDVNPGYLNGASLLGEHAELHAVASILAKKKSGYSRHPEVLRWAGCGWALKKRHRLLAAEMSLRGYTEKTPVLTRSNEGRWPGVYIDEPWGQFRLLEARYAGREKGRIPLPRTAGELWAQHKYSVLARDVHAYRTLGRGVSGREGPEVFARTALATTEILRTPPTAGAMRNALLHMWGHVSGCRPAGKGEAASWPLKRLFGEVRRRALEEEEPYLVASTALSELEAWLPVAP